MKNGACDKLSDLIECRRYSVSAGNEQGTSVKTGHGTLDLETITELAKKPVKQKNRVRAYSARFGKRGYIGEVAHAAQKACDRLEALGAFAGDMQLKENTFKALRWLIMSEDGPWRVSLNGLYTVRVEKAVGKIFVGVSPVKVRKKADHEEPKKRTVDSQTGNESVEQVATFSDMVFQARRNTPAEVKLTTIPKQKAYWKAYDAERELDKGIESLLTQMKSSELPGPDSDPVFMLLFIWGYGLKRMTVGLGLEIWRETVSVPVAVEYRAKSDRFQEELDKLRAAERVTPEIVAAVMRVEDGINKILALLDKSLSKEFVAVPSDMEKLFSTDKSVMIEGLNARIGTVENTNIRRMQQVYEAFKPYAEEKELPPGTTPQIMRFLVVSAGVPGLWKQMDEDNPRLAESLIGYYGEGLSTVELSKRMAGVTNPGSVGQFLERGLRWLWTHMPEKSNDFPIDKGVVFPLDKLQATRNERRKAAGTEHARKHHFHERGREFALRRYYGKQTD
jgi:hypothetical protein